MTAGALVPLVAGEALAAVTKAVESTCELVLCGQEPVIAQARAGRPVILTCWHSDDLVCVSAFPRIYPRMRGAVIVRDDPRGRTLQRFARRFNVNVVPLGTDPRSSEWARGVVRFTEQLRRGVLGMLAVDGPEGPARVAKPGAAVIAQRVGAIVVPTGVAARGAFRMRRWDRHVVPLPGSRLVVFTGTPLEPTPDAEETSLRIAAGIDAARAQAERVLAA